MPTERSAVTGGSAARLAVLRPGGSFQLSASVFFKTAFCVISDIIHSYQIQP